MATNKIRKEIANILSEVNANFMDEQQHAFLGYIGSGSSINSNTGMPSSDDDLLNQIFVKQFDNADRKFKSKTGITDVYVKRVNDTNYESLTSTGWVLDTEFNNIGTNTNTDRIVDINVYALADDTTSKPLLRKLYALHSLMHPKTWKSFEEDRVKGNMSARDIWTMQVKGPEINSTSKENNDISLSDAFDSDTSLKNALVRLAKQPLFHPFVLRRLVFLYIRMVSFYIAMDAYFKTDGKIQNAQNLAQGIYNLLDSEWVLLNSNSLSSVTTGVNKRIRRYNDFSDGVNEINSAYEKTRTFTKKNALRMEDEARFEKRASSLFYVALTVLLITVVVSAGAVFVDLEFKQKLMVAGGGLAFASVAGLVLVVLFTQQVVEGFNTNIQSSAFAFGDDTINRTMASYYNNAILELARDYLQSMSVLVHSLRSYRSFGNATYAMAKEYRYFNEADEHLRNVGEKYKATHRASDLYQKKYGASVYLFIVFALLLSAVATGYIAAGEKMPLAQPYVLGVGGFFAFVVLLVYILEVSGYVRTDGDKKYWGVPDTRDL